MGVVVLLRKSQLKHLKTIENRCFAGFAQQMWDVSTFSGMFVSRLAVRRERLEVQTVRFVCDSGKLATTCHNNPFTSSGSETVWAMLGAWKNTYQIVCHQNIFHFWKTPLTFNKGDVLHTGSCVLKFTQGHTHTHIYICYIHIYIYNVIHTYIIYIYML